MRAARRIHFTWRRQGPAARRDWCLMRNSLFWFDLELPVVARTEPVAVAPETNGSGRHAARFRGVSRHLLIVDDEPTNRNVLREFLAPLGFEIEEAADGAECLQRCAQRVPDALLLDLQMPKVDGFEVARRLRGRAETRGLKIIAVSASVFEEDRQQAIDAGCDDFLPKPFKEEQLLCVLEKALALEWTSAAPTAAADEPSVSVKNGHSDENGATLPIEEIDGMLELSRRGDILGIKKRRAGLAAVGDGNYAPFVQSLEPFVATYQMNRIRDALLKLKREKHT